MELVTYKVRLKDWPSIDAFVKPEEPDRMVYWGLPAHQILLAASGQILFRVEE